MFLKNLTKTQGAEDDAQMLAMQREMEVLERERWRERLQEVYGFDGFLEGQDCVLRSLFGIDGSSGAAAASPGAGAAEKKRAGPRRWAPLGARRGN